jgi:hypothetical protein
MTRVKKWFTPVVGVNLKAVLLKKGNVGMNKIIYRSANHKCYIKWVYDYTLHDID